MSLQPTRGEWYPELYNPDSPTFRKWTVRAKYNRNEGNFPDGYVCDIAHVWHNSVTRGIDQEKANVTLISQSKNMARALLAIIDTRKLSGQEFTLKWGEGFDPWQYAEFVIDSAKSEE